MVETTPYVTVSAVIRSAGLDPDLGVHDADLGVHDAAISAFTMPISAFTMPRFQRSRCSDLGVHDAARYAFAEEAEVICEYAEYVPAVSDDGRDADATAAGGAEQTAEPPRGAPVVRHRFDRTVGDKEVAESRRLVVLRDKRKGRPRGGSARSSTDPPT